MNSTISRAKEILVALMNSLLLVDGRVEVRAPYGDGAFEFAGVHYLKGLKLVGT
jgi:hypothetical protein